jgi:hypothetical protein
VVVAGGVGKGASCFRVGGVLGDVVIKILNNSGLVIFPR